MKHISTRAAAAVCAAITAVCGMQALSASAVNNAHPTTGNSQAYCNEPYNMSHNCYFWSVYNYPENSYWNTTVYSGKVLGEGFTTANISGTSQGSALTGAKAFARTLACSHFGSQNTIFVELPGGYANCPAVIRLGDQIVLTRNGSQHTIFITGINDETNTVYASEIVNNRVKHGVTFSCPQDGKLKRTSNNQTFNVSYVIRPAMEGDANGDCYIDIRDVDVAFRNEGNFNFPGKDYNTVMGAIDLNGSWTITHDDGMEIFYHINAGIMGGNYSYLTT